MTRRLFFRISMTLFSIILIVPLVSNAQLSKGAPMSRNTAGRDFVIRKFQGVGRQNLIKTPVYRSSVGGSTKDDREWGRVHVQYDTNIEWIDELVMDFYVMTLIVEDGTKKYSFYKKSVKYGDVKIGKAHNAAVYLRPQALERFGPIVAIAVEVSSAGTVLAKQDEIMKSGKIKLPDGDWWKDSRVVDSDLVAKRAGYLLNKKESPFSHVNIDDYEYIK